MIELFLIPWDSPFLMGVVLGGFGFLAYEKKWLDGAGTLIAVLFGLLTFTWAQNTTLGGWPAIFSLLVFFFAAQLASKLAHKNGYHHERRGISNVLGNGLAGLIGLAIGSPLGFFAAISAALSDTMSSEIGRLSKDKPILITTLRRVPMGEDGAVSFMGLGAGLVGALIMGLLFGFFTNSINGAIIITIAGFVGNLADSVIGAVFERNGIGNNTVTNFVGSGVGMLAAFLLKTAIGF